MEEKRAQYAEEYKAKKIAKKEAEDEENAKSGKRQNLTAEDPIFEIDNIVLFEKFPEPVFCQSCVHKARSKFSIKLEASLTPKITKFH
jgi:hypothetical protein